MKKHLFFVVAALAVGSLATVGCGGSSSAEDGSGAEDSDITKASVCKNATTLTCKPGFEISTAGCASSRVAGSAPYGRCVGTDTDALVGSWSDLADTNAANIELYSFDFAADGTYSGRGGCPPAAPGEASCHAIVAESGTWGFVRGGPQLGDPEGPMQIQTIDSFKQKTNYFYSLDKNKLSLSKSFTGDKSVFEKADDSSASK